MSVYTDILITRFVQRGVQGFERDLGRLGTNVGTFESRVERMGLLGSRLTSLGIATASAVGLITVASLKLAGQQQTNMVAFTKLTGSAEAARSKLKELADFARVTPFTLQQLVKSSQQLVAMGFTTDEIIPTMRSLGDAMSGLGASEETFGRVVYNLGQIRAQGKATMLDLRQFAMAGINVREVMQLAMGKPIDLKALTRMPQQEFIPAFLKGLDKKFGGLMAQTAKTLPGMMSNLKDEAEQAGMAIGSLFIQDGSNLVGWLTKAARAATEFSKQSPGVARFGIVTAAGGAAALIAYGQYLKYRQIILTTRAAKMGLSAATRMDSVAETVKTGVARREAAAIGASGVAATGAARAKNALRGATVASTGALGTELAAERKLANLQRVRYSASRNLSRSVVAKSGAETAVGSAETARAAAEARQSAASVNLPGLRSSADDAAARLDAARGAGPASQAALDAEKAVLDAKKAQYTVSKALSRSVVDQAKASERAAMAAVKQREAGRAQMASLMKLRDARSTLLSAQADPRALLNLDAKALSFQKSQAAALSNSENITTLESRIATAERAIASSPTGAATRSGSTALEGMRARLTQLVRRQGILEQGSVINSQKLEAARAFQTNGPLGAAERGFDSAEQAYSTAQARALAAGSARTEAQATLDLAQARVAATRAAKQGLTTNLGAAVNQAKSVGSSGAGTTASEVSRLEREAARAAAAYEKQASAYRSATTAVERAVAQRAVAEAKLTKIASDEAAARALRARVTSQTSIVNAELEAARNGSGEGARTLFQRIGAAMSKEIPAITNGRRFLARGGAAGNSAVEMERFRAMLTAGVGNGRIAATAPSIAEAAAEVAARRAAAVSLVGRVNAVDTARGIGAATPAQAALTEEAREAVKSLARAQTVLADVKAGRAVASMTPGVRGGAGVLLRMQAPEIAGARLFGKEIISTTKFGIGAALGAGMEGLFAGLGVHEDLKATGYGDKAALAASLTTGLGAAALTALSPPAAALIAAAGLLRVGANMLYSNQIEAKAEEGNGLTDKEMDAQKGMTPEQKAEDYVRKAEQKRKEAAGLRDVGVLDWNASDSNRADELDQDAQSMTGFGVAYGRSLKADRERKRKAEEQAALQSRMNEFAVRNRADLDAANPNGGMVDTGADSRQAQQRWEEGSTQTRNLSSRETRGGQTQMVIQHTVTIPARESDRATGRRHYRSMVPAGG